MGDPIHAFGAFGRYISESLAWEKRSTFSRNRYLEEAEKYSKPGSVAKMKAFFEAHHKRVASKKEAALLEEANKEAKGVTKLEVRDANQNSSSSESEMTTAENHPFIDQCQQNKATQMVSVSGATVDSCITKISVTESENESGGKTVGNNGDNECHKGDNIPNRKSVSGVTVDSSSLMTPVEESKINQTEGINIAENECCPESSAQFEKNQHEDADKHDVITVNPKRKVLIKTAVNQKHLDSKSKQKAPDSSLISSTHAKASNVLSSLARLSIPIRSKKEENATTKTKNSLDDSFRKNILTRKSLHVSINVDSHIGNQKRTSPTIQKPGIKKVISPPVKVKGHSSTPMRRTSRASVKRTSRHPLVTSKSDIRRTLKSLSSRMCRAQSSITFIPFTFKSEERAAKRREFFQKQQEAEKMRLLHKAKQKREKHARKPSEAMNFRAKAIASSRTQASIFSNQKIPQTLPKAPILGRKPAFRDTGAQPPRWRPLKADASSRAAEKNKMTTGKTAVSQPKK
ncbi:hypothetical protein Ancab_018978 [Ancistrocladus abbreviatus]